MADLPMFRTFILVLLSQFNLETVQSAAIKIQEKCVPYGQDQSHCYTLYGSPSASYTWSEALAECSDMGQALLTIQDAQEQSHITDLLVRAQSEPSTVHVWIAGRISDDQTLTYVNGDTVGTEITLVTSPLGCGVRYQLGFYAVECTGDNRKALCQYDADSCKSGDFLYAGHCYHIYIRDDTMHWNLARQYCRDYERGDLAYSSVGDSGLWQAAEENLGESVQSVWLGFTSRHYVWIEGTTETPVSFTYFKGGGSGKCVHLDPKDWDNVGKWITKPCNDSNSYFICETTKAGSQFSTTAFPTTQQPASTSQPTAQPTAQSTAQPTAQLTAQPTAQHTAQPTAQSTAQSTAQPTLTTKPSQNSTQNPGEQTAKEPLLTKEHIIGIAVGGGALLIIVIVIIAVVVTRGKREKREDEPEITPYNTHIHGTASSIISHKETKPNIYSEVPDDGATGGADGNAETGEIEGYKRAPQGDLYSLPKRFKKKKDVEKLGPVYENMEES